MSESLIPMQERPKGVVDPAIASQRFRLARYQPDATLAAYLDHFWLVAWDLPDGVSHTQRTLPYPCVNLVFDAGRTAVFGVVSGSFEYTIQGKGQVLGLRFRPGAFRGVLGRPMHTLTDQIASISEVFGLEAAGVENTVLGATDDAGMVAAASAFLTPYLGEPDAKVERVNGILALAQADTQLTRVEQLAERAGMGMRSLQQLFADYVGVSPKWVIRRYRLHEAADQLAAGATLDLATLAQTLGYYDQAHFTRDFRKLVGKPPQQYLRQNQV